MTYLLLVVCTYLFLRYVEPIFDLYLEVFQYKQSEKANKYQLNAQEQVILFQREYPESNQIKQQELTPAIGFAYSKQDDDYYYDDEDCK